MFRPTLTTMSALTERTFSFDELEEILIYFSGAIMREENEDDMLWDVVRNCIAKLNLLDCVIYFVDTRKRVLVQKAAYGPKSPGEQKIFQPISIPLGKGITGTVALTGRAEIVNDTTKDKRYIVDDDVRLSEIAVPILIDGKVFGVIDCEHPLPGYFTEQHLRILTAIASLLAVRLSRIRIEKKMIQKEKRLLQAKQEAADLRIRALKAQMNPHFVFNAINAIQHFITTQDKKSALRYLSLFSKLLRFYLQYLEEDTIRLTDEIRILTWYLTLQELRYDGKFSFETEPLNSVGEIRIPALVAQLFVEETVEHLMFTTSGECSIKVSMHADPKTVTISLHITREKTRARTKRAASADYRRDLPKLKDHLKLNNQIKKFKITTKKRAPVQKNKGMITEIHDLVLPAIE